MNDDAVNYAYLGDWDPVQERSSFLGRARQGPRLIREIDNRIALYAFAAKPFWRRIPDTARVVGLNPDRRQNLLYVNLPFDVVRAMTGLMFYVPSVEAVPRSVDPEDIARAHATKDIADHLIETCRLGAQYREILQMCHMYGMGWMKVSWNPDGGQRQPVVQTVPCPTCQGTGVVRDQTGYSEACPTCNTQGMLDDPNGKPPAYPGYINSYLGTRAEGEVEIQAVHPDDIYIDSDAPSVDEPEEIYHNIRMSPEAAWRKYGKSLGVSQSEFEQAPKNVWLSTFDTNAAAALLRPTMQRYINIGEYYRKPDEKHPEGIFAIYLGDSPIYAGPLPYMHDRHPFPFFPFPLYTIKGVQYPISTLDLVLPMVFAMNDHLSAQHARARISARLRFKMPVDSRAQVNTDTGHLEYRDRPGRAGPEPLALAAMPQDAVQIREILAGYIDRISGATDLIRGGSSVSEADSARALAFLEERAVGPIKPVIADHADRQDRVIKYAVELARIYYDDGRVFRATGASGAVEVREFRTENVGESTDIRVRTIRDVGRSRSTMMAELNEAAKIGAIDPATYQKLAEYGEMGPLYEERRTEMDMATFENQTLSRYGQIPPPNKRQDHDIHNDCHKKWLNVATMRNGNDPLIPVMLAHMDAHDQAKATLAVEAQMLQQQAAAAFGQANAANPQMQPQSAVDAAQAAAPTTEPYQNAPTGGEQGVAQASARAAEVEQSANANNSPAPNVPVGREG